MNDTSEQRAEQASHTPGPLRIVRGTDEIYGWETCLIIENDVPDNDENARHIAFAFEDAPDEARLLAAAYTSYDKHFQDNAVQAAEQDVLGKLIEACLAAREYLADMAVRGGPRKGLPGIDDWCDTQTKLADALSLIPQQEANANG